MSYKKLCPVHRSIIVMSGRLTYIADDLNRIASVNCGTSTWAHNFTYDPFGNISKANAGNAISYQAAYSALTNQVNGGITLPGYDADGNQLSRRVASVPATFQYHVEGAPGPLYLCISGIFCETAVVGELRHQLPRGRAAPVVPLVE
jgi:hypothetical protein